MPLPAGRTKRAAESLVRPDLPSAKKPRFDARNPSTLAADAPSEDAILDLDEIGKPGLHTKRNAVNIDGYESDSEGDNFDARAAERETAGEDAGGKDDDMFADLEGDGDGDGLTGGVGGRQKKEVRFLDSASIEGQDMGSTAGGHVSADVVRKRGDGRAASVDSTSASSSSSGGEELRDEVPSDVDAEVGAGGKKKHAPRLDAFNTRAEEEEGRYDESGNYVRRAADPDSVHDSWLEGLSKRDMKRAREAQEKREGDVRRRAERDDGVLTCDLLAALIGWLGVAETAMEALRRLERAAPKSARALPRWKRKVLDVMEVDRDGGNDGRGYGAAETARREAVEGITGAADALFARGLQEVYEMEREMLMRQYRRETGDEWAAPAAKETEGDVHAEGGSDAMWQYRWSDGRDGGAHNGPYDRATMKAWDDAGYFGEGVEFRRIGREEWSGLAEFG